MYSRNYSHYTKTQKTNIIPKRRDKVLVIVETPDNKFLYVQDSNTSEWAYIVGGCKAKTTPLQNAVKEFHEETNDALELSEDRFEYLQKFYTTFRPPELLRLDKLEKIRVTSHFHVFRIRLNIEECSILSNKYYINKDNVSNENVETKNIMFAKRTDSIWTKEPVWNFMDKIVYQKINNT